MAYFQECWQAFIYKDFKKQSMSVIYSKTFHEDCIFVQ